MTTAEGEHRTSLHRIVDCGIYAPIGFALEFRRLVPELAESGRSQIEFSRSLGRAALKTALRAAASHAPRDPGATGDEPIGDEIAGYETMSARNIIDLAASATGPQLRWMLEAEQSGKQRVTVLRRLTSLLEGDPA